ncbi:glycosyltransferase [Microbacterium sp. ARD31]|uniref:glycosyltransferase n=1 Tax=Microbacterium sp. ARD31 TaxID=2962576 RepID=UPI0028823D5A|nr:glycosyltransferase [Microbacterium sp. ARD31]MDT0186479.1 glycosyltransferase [Microbacterium sp. ARD31]
MDLVVASLEAWDTVWRRNQHLVSRLLRDDPTLRVLFVEPAADPLHDLISRRRAGRGVPVSEVAGFHGRLLRYRPVKLLPRRLDPRVDERLAHRIMHAAMTARMTRPLLWANDPSAATLSCISRWPTLYDITDDWAVADRTPSSLARVRTSEDWLLEHAAEVVACSAELVRRKAPSRAPRPIHLVPNAVDVFKYRTPAARPDDLPRVSAVYVGTLHRDRLDIELCEQTARELVGRGTLVLVGPDALSRADAERLREAGVALLGRRPHEQVVGYLQHADALVVPHVVTEFTDSLDPIKLYEYAAVGRPVVATAVAGFRDAEPPVRVASRAEFPRTVASVVPATTRFPVGAHTRVATWEDRATDLRDILSRMPS